MDDLVSKLLDLSSHSTNTWQMQDLAVPPPTPASCSYRPPVSSCLCLAGPEAVFDPGFRLSPHLLLRCFICILHLCGNLGWTPHPNYTSCHGDRCTLSGYSFRSRDRSRRRDNTILCGKENQLPCGDYTADQKATVYDSYQHTQSILRVHVDLGSREV